MKCGFCNVTERRACMLFVSQAREQEDDEIVDALNAYTAKLQQSLQIINSTEE